jgi:hypothetical protein
MCMSNAVSMELRSLVHEFTWETLFAELALMCEERLQECIDAGMVEDAKWCRVQLDQMNSILYWERKQREVREHRPEPGV